MGHPLHPPSSTREKLSKRSGCRTIPQTRGMIHTVRGSSKLIFLVEWDTRRRVTHPGRLVLPGLMTGINRPRQRWADELDCFSLMATAHITHLGSWNTHTTITLLCYVILHIRLTSIKGSMLSSSVSWSVLGVMSKTDLKHRDWLSQNSISWQSIPKHTPALSPRVTFEQPLQRPGLCHIILVL